MPIQTFSLFHLLTFLTFLLSCDVSIRLPDDVAVLCSDNDFGTHYTDLDLLAVTDAADFVGIIAK